jgi:hypothetical protein
MTPLQTLLWLVVAFALLVPATRWFSQRVQSLMLLITRDSTIAIYGYFVLLLPGVLLHELSHWLLATVLGVRTGRLSLRPRVRRGGALQMGALQYQRTDIVRESLVGLAPLVAGTVVVLLVARHLLGIGPEVTRRLEQLPGTLWAAAGARDAWLWVYLITAVSNAMLPSASDRASWQTLGLYLGLVILLLVLVGGTDQVSDRMLGLGVTLARHLAYAYSLSVVLDVGVGSALWLTERLLSLLVGRRVA